MKKGLGLRRGTYPLVNGGKYLCINGHPAELGPVEAGPILITSAD